MVIINPILNHWMTSPYQWLLTMSIDHINQRVTPICGASHHFWIVFRESLPVETDHPFLEKI